MKKIEDRIRYQGGFTHQKERLGIIMFFETTGIVWKCIENHERVKGELGQGISISGSLSP